jgi:hypothetical protein
MATLDLTDEQIRIRGLEALHRELGPAGVIRFLRQFELGRGDYSTERHQWLDEQSVESLGDDLKQNRDSKPRS